MSQLQNLIAISYEKMDVLKGLGLSEDQAAMVVAEWIHNEKFRNELDAILSKKEE